MEGVSDAVVLGPGGGVITEIGGFEVGDRGVNLGVGDAKVWEVGNGGV